METLYVYQVASLRIASAGLILLILTVMHIRSIPFVAIFRGIMAKEDICWKQSVSLIVILTGVYIATRTGKVIAVAD